MRTSTSPYLSIVSLLVIVVFFLSFVWLDAQPGQTQSAPILFQLTDQQFEEQGSSPANFVALGGLVYFGVENGNLRGFWRTDGTAAGTGRIADLQMYPRSLHRVGNALYFQTSGNDLWTSDGTVAGTILLHDNFYSDISTYVMLNELVYFPGADDRYGIELWQSDGTPDGTELVVDSAPGTSGTGVYHLVVLGDRLYYLGSVEDEQGELVRGSALWESDGTAAGTRVLSNVPGYVTDFVVFQEKLYYTVYDDDDTLGPSSLWRYEGDSVPPSLVQNFSSISAEASLLHFVATAQTLFFTVDQDRSIGDEDTDISLWSSDGTNNGTQLLKVGAPIVGQYTRTLIAVGNQVYFTVYDPDAPAELWKSDGTVTGTALVKVLPAGNLDYYYVPNNFTVLNDTLYFLAYPESVYPDYAATLMKSDGTAEGTVPVITKGMSNLQAAGDALYMSLLDSVNEYELGRSDGTAAGTQLVADINPSTAGPAISQAAYANGQLYVVGNFSESTDLPNPELRVSANGTRPAALLNNDFTSYLLRTVGDRLFILTEQNELRLLNPETSQLDLLKTYTDEDIAIYFDAALPINGNLYFFTSTGPTRPDTEPTYYLNRSDGTPEGTARLLNNVPSLMQRFTDCVLLLARSQILLFDNSATTATSFVPTGLSGSLQQAFIGESFFYVAEGPATDGGESHIWRSDGTLAGTVRLVAPEPLLAIHDGFVAGNDLYVRATTAAHGIELWHATPGADTLTRLTDLPLVGEVRDYYFSSDNAVTVGANVYFVIDDGSHGRELWTSNGTAAGTRLVKDIVAGNPSNLSFAYPTPLFSTATSLFFVAYNMMTGSELWQSDGTDAGTTILVDIAPGDESSLPSDFQIQGTNFYFTAENSQYGRELWRSDGTAVGTQLVLNPYGGSASSYPNLYAWVDHLLFFTADNGCQGRQLFSLSTGASAAQFNATTGDPIQIPCAMGSYQVFLPDINR